MNKILFSLALYTSCFALDFKNAEEITYEKLVEQTDYLPYFHEIFSQMKVDTLLEFGYGLSTKYFLDECNKVISVEFVTNGCGPEGIKGILELLKDRSNWIPISYFTGYYGDTSWAPYKHIGTDKIYKAISYHCSLHQNYALIDNSYLNELKEFINNLVTSHKIDAVSVNTTAYVRGDLVRLLFNKVPIICAHHTRCRIQGEKNDVYGYSRVVTPDNYEEIYHDKGSGITFWISKEEKYKGLIESLSKEV